MKTKPIKMTLGALGVATAISMVVISCGDDDTVTPYDTTALGTTTLLSKKATTAPTIDGTIDALWANLPKLEFTATVPTLEASVKRPGCNIFGGFEGKTNNVTIRSVYDATNIYFLVEWTDPTESKDRASWYFDASSSRWKQEDQFGCSNGTIGLPYYEDKFAFMWNISEPASDWNATTCYTNCHTGLSAPPWEDKVKHYTNSANEKTDVWHWKYVRTNMSSQLDDQRWVYADPSNPSSPSKGGRGDDAKTSGGYSDNKQTLTFTDTAVSVSVPKYVIPGQTNYYWITKAQIDDGTAKLVTAVNSAGVLTYSGGTVDPAGDSGYNKGAGTKRFPSIYSGGPAMGSLGDVSAFGKHTGSGWVLEIKRALSTGNDDDVVFDGVSDYMFGVGVFENANIAHAIKTNLTLDFE